MTLIQALARDRATEHALTDRLEKVPFRIKPFEQAEEANAENGATDKIACSESSHRKTSVRKSSLRETR
jgi:hypothetical protein